jgi:hypothetical protein
VCHRNSNLICRGGSDDEAAAYLVSIASEHMGLSKVNADAAAATSAAIAAYIATLPDVPEAGC